MSHTEPVAEPRVDGLRADYVVAILGTEVLIAVLGVLDIPGSPGGNVLQLVAYPLGLLLGIVLWLRAPSRAPARGLLRAFIVLALALWLLESGRIVIGGGRVSIAIFTVLLLLVMIWMKPPSARAGRAVVDAMAWILIGAVLVALVLEVVGLALSWYRLYPMFVEFIPGDRAAYWLPLVEPLGLDGRWAGPFPHPNMAGPVGGFLIVVGLCRRGWLQWAAITTGLVVLVLTSSRTSTIAALVGALVVLAASALRRWPRSWESRVALVGTPAVIAGLLLATAAHTTPAGAVTSTGVTLEQFSSLSGRTSIWPVYLRIWQESPWFGVPEARIAYARQSGELPGWAITAHSLPLDALVSFGILGGMLVAAALGVAALLAWRATARGRIVGLGILAVIATCGIAETLVFWRVFAASTILLLLAVLASLPESPDAPATESTSPAAP